MSGLTGRREGPAELRASVPADPAEVGHLRRAVVDAVRRWGVRVDVDILSLLVSEVLTNALVHGRPPLELRVQRVGEGVRVDVLDAAGDARPRPRGTPSPDDPRGRGLTIVAALATRWGTAPVGSGKAVWFELEP